MTKLGTLRFYGLLFFLLSSTFLNASTIEVAGSFETIQCDNIGFIYATRDNNIYKYNNQGKLLYTYNYNKYGAKPSIDVSTPMRILLYFADFKKIIILDSRLTEVRGIDVNLYSDIENPTLACFSKDQNIWMYNATRFTLIKMDNIGNRIYESQSLAILTNTSISPTKIKEQENHVFLLDTAKGILMFDILGTYLKTVPIKSVESFQVKDGKLFFYNNNKFQSIDLNTFDIETYQVNDDPTVRKILLSNESLIKLSIDKFSISSMDAEK